MRIINITPGLLPIPPNGWGATEKIIWEYHSNLLKIGYDSQISYLDNYNYKHGDVVHIHIANLASIAKERDIPYYFTCHDHHAFLYGKDSNCFKQNYDAIKYSIKSFVPAKYLVDYFDLPNLQYLSHGVNSDIYIKTNNPVFNHKLLCVANNGFIHDQSEDRKGFGYAIDAARVLNLPITIAGPSNNKKFFETHNCIYDKLNIVYDLSENELISLYQDHTIFLHPSILEAGHPNLTLLEAMSCGLPVVGTFEENNELSGLLKTNRDVDKIVDSIKTIIHNYPTYQNYCAETVKKLSWTNIVNKLLSIYKSENVMKNQLLDIYEKAVVDHKDCISEKNKLVLNFNDNCKVELLGPIEKKYNIKFIDKKLNTIIYETNIKNNMWCAPSPKYYIDWKIKITDLDTQSITTYDFNLKHKHVCIINESPSLGDYIAWIPYIDEFRKKHNCIIDFYTPNKQIFEDNYNEINFYNYNEYVHNLSNKSYYATYRIGCFDPTDRSKSPVDYRTQNLQEIAAGILGLDYQEILPKIVIGDTSPKLNEKYVCISTASTAGCKHWQNENGWQMVVDYLNSLGYKVVVIQKEALDYMDLIGLKNVIHPETKTLNDAIQWIYNCEFFVGLSSGVSWLSWCLKKPVVLISGFTKPKNEFYTPYRVINENVCNGCWNDTNYKFDSGDWNWCPKLKNTDRQFECSKQITFDDVKKQIDNIINKTEILKYKNLDSFTYKEIFELNQYEKYICVENNDVVLDLGCSKGYFYLKHKDKNIKYIGVDGSIDCLNDFIQNTTASDQIRLIHAVVGKTREIKSFPSMFHGNRLKESLQVPFDEIIQSICCDIDFLKFDIEGSEVCMFEDYYELLKSKVKKFSGEIHFGEALLKQKNMDILSKIKLDPDIKHKLFSVDGIDITEYFWTNADYYTEIIISAEIVQNRKI